ncbi:MAG: hypothetical protein IT515_02510 [Burkholderiales bacterium]|jgi:cation transport ATPase|nr:hypothetical protein [Burkholderiales bacterium]
MLSWSAAVSRSHFFPARGANFAVVLGYRAILPLFPVAAGPLYPLAIGQEVAAIAMSGSSLPVAANARLLERAVIEGLK